MNKEKRVRISKNILNKNDVIDEISTSVAKDLDVILFENVKNENENIKKLLEEKDKQIKDLQLDNQKLFDKWATREYVNQNQKAIECLKEVKRYVDGRTYLANFIDNKIKELKGEK